MNKIKVLLVDDEQSVNESLSEKLSKNDKIQMVTQFPVLTETDFYHVINNTQVDVVLLDMEFDQVDDGIRILRKFSQLKKPVKTLILSGIDDNVKIVKEAIKAGARGYIAKKDSTEQIITGINYVYENRNQAPYYGSTIGNLFEKANSKNKKGLEGLTQVLTLTELKNFKYIAAGYTTKQISKALGVGTSATRKHKENIKDKIPGLNNDTDFTFWIIDHAPALIDELKDLRQDRPMN